jgi:hypothetical protein
MVKLKMQGGFFFSNPKPQNFNSSLLSTPYSTCFSHIKGQDVTTL